jgi:RNA polymerase primary sigma factor
MENENITLPDALLMKESLACDIRDALSTLHGREAQVLTLFYGLNRERAMTLEEIGEKFDLTRERVRQIKERATQRLRRSVRSNKLIGYLG